MSIQEIDDITKWLNTVPELSEKIFFRFDGAFENEDLVVYMVCTINDVQHEKHISTDLIGTIKLLYEEPLSEDGTINNFLHFLGLIRRRLVVTEMISDSEKQ